MVSRQLYTLVNVPREGINDDTVRVVEWLVGDGERAEPGKPFVILETAKATVHLDAPRSGFFFHLVPAGAVVQVGMPLAVVAEQRQRPVLPLDLVDSKVAATNGEQIITRKARLLLEEHGLSPAAFSGQTVVRSSDVESLLEKRAPVSEPAVPAASSEKTNTDRDTVCDTDLHRELKKLLAALRQRMKAGFDRHVSTGNLLHDRWELAKDHGFGEGTSVYDDCLILGQVVVGRHCWIGPQTVLDGQGTLTIGDYVDVGAGTHLYSHNTIERALTGHRAPMFKKSTTIGSCCFIAPQVVIAPGTVIGDHCFVAAGSYVEGSFPSLSFIAGNPAKRVGVVELRNDRARLTRFSATVHDLR
jgi:acetyltransferase-like isoleucine patch superfamily enzyme